MDSIENPLGAVLLVLLLITFAGLKRLMLRYKQHQRARQEAEDDLLIAYITWLQEQDLRARQEQMAQARKHSTPSFQN